MYNCGCPDLAHESCQQIPSSEEETATPNPSKIARGRAGKVGMRHCKSTLPRRTRGLARTGRDESARDEVECSFSSSSHLPFTFLVSLFTDTPYSHFCTHTITHSDVDCRRMCFTNDLRKSNFVWKILITTFISNHEHRANCLPLHHSSEHVRCALPCALLRAGAHVLQQQIYQSKLSKRSPVMETRRPCSKWPWFVVVSTALRRKSSFVRCS